MGEFLEDTQVEGKGSFLADEPKTISTAKDLISDGDSEASFFDRARVFSQEVSFALNPAFTPQSVQKMGVAGKETGLGLTRGGIGLPETVGQNMNFIGRSLKVSKPAIENMKKAGLISPLKAELAQKMSDKLVDYGESVVKHWNGEKEYLEKFKDKETWEGTFEENPNAIRIMSSVAESVPMMALGVAGGGAAQSSWAGAAILGSAEGLGVFTEALEKGKSDTRAITTGVLAGTASTGIEGALNMAGFGVLEDMINPKIAKNFLARFSTNMVSEGTQEGLQTFTTNLVRKYGIDKTISIQEGLVESIVVGAVTGGAMTGFASSAERKASVQEITPEELAEGMRLTEDLMKANGEDLDATLTENLEFNNQAIEQAQDQTTEGVTIEEPSLSLFERQHIENISKYDTPESFVADIESAGRVVEYEDVLSEDFLSILDKGFTRFMGGIESLPSEFYRKDVSLGQVLEGFDNLGATDEIMPELTIELKNAGYSRVGDFLITESGMIPRNELESLFSKSEEIIRHESQDKDVRLTPEELQQQKVQTYETNRQMKQQQTKFIDNVSEKAKDLYNSGTEWLDRALVPLSTRLEKISPKLKETLRRFEFNTMNMNAERNKQTMPFLEAYSKLSVEEAADLDLALKNIDLETVNEIVERNDMKEEYEDVAILLEEIYDEALDVGLDVGYIEDYFPRRVLDSEKYLAYLNGTPSWSAIEKAIKQKEGQMGAYLGSDERAEFIGTLIRGYGESQISLRKPSNVKSRKILELTPEMNQYYKDSSQSLVDYVRAMTENIEARKMFGKGEKDIDASIGHVIDGMIQAGEISRADEQKAKEILSARFNKKGTYGIWSAYKNIMYMTILGTPISALTQIEDLGVSLYKNGLVGTTKGLLDSISKEKGITVEDLGIESIAQEFLDEKTGKKAMEKLFKATGFNYMDRLGKESYINGVFESYKKAAQESDPVFIEKIENIFGEESKQTIEDMKNGEISPNVKYLMFTELAEIQPIALSEMPEYYVKGGNLRIFYALKSFTLKRIDFVRREIFDTMKDDPKQGLQNFARLSMSLVLMGATTDAIKDLLLGRKVDLPDMMVNNFFKMFGFGKWVVYQARREGLMSALSRQILPPMKLYDDLYKDLVTQRELPDWSTWASVPLFGKFYYWWFGGGSQSGKERKKEVSKKRRKTKKKRGRKNKRGRR